MRTALAVLVALVACHSAAAPQRPAAPAPSAQRSRVGVVSHDGGRHAVAVELATSEEGRRQGLMFREKLAADDGMLFVFDREQPLTFWMHNTLIPLDMVFIHTDGTVTGVVENAAPQTDTPRGVPGTSRYVLEVNGGWCAAHGVRAGDRVELSEALEAARPKDEAGRAR